jgi:predicted nucleic acid-binding protein
MPGKESLRAVIDTNVVFEGLTKQGSSSGLVIDCWLADLFRGYVSNALAYEYSDVLSRKLSERRWKLIKPTLGALLRKSQYVNIYYTWRPISPDPCDDLVIDCAMNAGATVVTKNTKDFIKANKTLGLRVWTPIQLLQVLLE